MAFSRSKAMTDAVKITLVIVAAVALAYFAAQA